MPEHQCTSRAMPFILTNLPTLRKKENQNIKFYVPPFPRPPPAVNTDPSLRETDTQNWEYYLSLQAQVPICGWLMVIL